jgi:hypothetical protein
MNLVLSSQEIFLDTDEGVEEARKFNQSGLSGLSEKDDAEFGRKILAIERQDKLKNNEITTLIQKNELDFAKKYLSDKEGLKISDGNWLPLLNAIITIEENFTAEEKTIIGELFKGEETKDFCLSNLQKIWCQYLDATDAESFSISLSFVSRQIKDFGAGPLSHVEALGNYIQAFRSALLKKTTVERTQQEVRRGAKNMEARFKKERWSREDKSNFYNISADILNAAPSLLASFLKTFEKMKPAQMERFMVEIFPLYRAKLALLEKGSGQNETKQYSIRDLALCRKDIKNLATELPTRGDAVFAEQKSKLVGDIGKIFKEKYGIIKIPDNFTDENMRSLVNFSIYTANLHGRTPEKEVILGFYLALNINGKWDSFRQGEEINSDNYLIPEKSATIKQMLIKRESLDPLSSERIGVVKNEMTQFNLIFQRETQNVVIGGVETVDVKLANVLINLQGLCDLDLYSDPLQKACMKLLLEYDNKRVGAVVGKMYQELANPSRPIQYKEGEAEIKEKIGASLIENGLRLEPDVLKKYFQDGAKPLAMVVNLLNFLAGVKVEHEIEEIRRLLIPTDEIIKVFNHLGEEFRSESGALAVSQDLNYLDNLIIKRENDLKPEEKKLLSEYIKQIRTQLIKMEDIYEQIKNKFSSLKQSQSNTANVLFRTKLEETEKIINSQAAERPIISTMTGDINRIIENIRECLSCKNQGCNNDTNLTFGDSNKFFIYSQAEGQKKDGSIADQIVFVEPITYSDKTSGLAFVFDRIYGANTPTILLNHINVVIKKYNELKKQFPNLNLNIIIPDSIVFSGTISDNSLREKLEISLENYLDMSKDEVAINVIPSSVGDHYVEFGGGARTFGERKVNALVLKSK